jgi:glycine cleavage system H protein
LNLPESLKYTETHEWLRVESDGTVTIGITDHAQDALGERVYVELPAPGRTLAQGEACIVVESTKAASDVYAPVAGDVIEVNDALSQAPQSVNESPYDKGWLMRLRPLDPAQIDQLLSAAAYGSGPGAA